MKTITPYTSLRRIVAGMLFGTLASGLAGIAGAADSDVPHRLVKYGDLNVSSPEGAATLYARIRIAAAEVCRSFDSREFATQNNLKFCVHKAIADAVKKVDQPELYAVYNAKSGTSKPIIVASRTR
jgi:UrcA family protein